LGDVVKSLGDIGGWEEVGNEKGSVEAVLGFNNEEGVEDLRIDPTLHCSHFVEVWHLFCW